MLLQEVFQLNNWISDFERLSISKLLCPKFEYRRANIGQCLSQIFTLMSTLTFPIKLAELVGQGYQYPSDVYLHAMSLSNELGVHAIQD